MELIIKFALLSCLISVVNGTCTDATFQYGTTPFTSYTAHDTATNAGYLMDSPDYRVPDACTCGVLKSWHFLPNSAGAVQFQVWSRVANNLYILQGENYFTVTTSFIGIETEFVVPTKDRITVKGGYLIGWYGATSGVIKYKEGDDTFPDEQKQRTSMSDLVVGASTDWTDGAVTTFNRRVYAIGASVTENTSPGFTNLPRTIQIYRTTTTGSFLFKPIADDLDQGDVSDLIISTPEDSTTDYYYETSSGFVRLGSTTPTVGTTTMTFTVTDQCGNSDTGVLTIVVLNWSPSITSLPAFASIAETSTIEIELGTVAVTDSDDTSLTVSSGLTVSPAAGTKIQLKAYGADGMNRSIVSTEGASWSYTTSQQYVMNLQLQDGQGATTDTGYFLLYITKNDPPKFTNLNNAATANASYLTTASGDLIYTVSATDAEDDPLTFTVTCTACPFTYRDGSIYASSDLIRTYVPGYDLLIDVSDGTTTLAQKTLTILIQDIDDKPVITNLPLAYPLVVFEGTALGTTVFTVRYTDLDTTDAHTIQATYNPAWGINYFSLNTSSGVLTTAYDVINYEELAATSIVLTIKVSDGQDWDTQTLTINIGNVNEAPSFHQTSYKLSPAEEGTYGSNASSPNFEVNDPDAGDTFTYSWDCGTNNRYFYMDSAGAITYAAVFDYDTSTVTLPYNCTVTVTDSGGLTGTTLLQIDIQDTNDNSPIFSQSTDYVLVQPHTLADDRFVGQVSASDADRSDVYGTIYYSFLVNPFSKSFIYINDFGNIYVNESWSRDTSVFDYGKSYVLEILAVNAVDAGGTRRAATATVTLLLPGTSTSIAVTTDRPLAFQQDPRNVAWLTVAGALVLGLAVLGSSLVLAYTVQVKRYRWCIPWCRKRLLGLQKLTRRQKRQYYMDALEQDALEKQRRYNRSSSSSSSSSADSDEEYWAELGNAPALSNWAGRGGQSGADVPLAARYNEPKPPLKRALSRMLLQKGGPKLFDP